MSTLIEILTFLIRVFGSLYLCVILLRFLLQTVRADFYNPVSQMLVTLTNPLLIPLRRVIPGLWGVDIAAIVLAILFHWLVMQILLFVIGGGFITPLLIVPWSIVGVLLNIITIYVFAGLVLMIVSFVAPFSANPVVLLVKQLLTPLMAPIQRYVPSAGGLDFSLFFLMIGLYILRIVIKGIGAAFGTPLPLLIGYA